MRAIALIAAAALVTAAPAAADRFERKLAGLSTKSQVMTPVEIPAAFETEAEFETARDTLLEVSKDACQRNHGSSAMRTVILRPCVANTFKSAVEQLPETPARVALLAYWADEMDPDRG